MAGVQAEVDGAGAQGDGAAVTPGGYVLQVIGLVMVAIAVRGLDL